MLILNGIPWKLYRNVLIPDVATHIDIILNEEDKKYLLHISKAFFLRWTTDWDRKNPTNFWYVIKDTQSSLEELSRNTRSKVRRGLKNCIAEKVSVNYIADNAYKVYRNALKRYGSDQKPASREEFRNLILKNNDDEQWEYWAVWNRERRLIAYSQNRIEQNTCNYSTIKFDPKYLKLYPSYALFYTMNNYYLGEFKFLYVNEGARSLSHETNIQDFLIEKFRFRKAYCKLHVYYNWYTKIIVKVLFPVRHIFYRMNNRLSRKIVTLLRHEEIVKSSGSYAT